ncbi:MAG: DUF1800 domain-containing protein, partial [Pseudomonadota bacterium]
FLAAFLASGPLKAGPDAMDVTEARHLISRTGFGAAPDEIAALTGLSYAEGVDQILSGLGAPPVTPLPAWTSHWGYPAQQIYTLEQTAAELFFAMRYLELAELQQWWLAEMIATPDPMQERLTLFWHSHFATSFEGVENPLLMARQHGLLRMHASGDFAALSRGILTDPAMLIYLSNTENSREAPNEDLAREFFELFTLGEGRGYTEADIAEAARALTGYGVAELSAPVFRFVDEAHDPGTKSILGRAGTFQGEDLADLALEHPSFGPYIVERLWREFISDTPDPMAVEELVEVWRAAEWQLQPLLRAMLLHEAFWAEDNRGRLIKGPIELMVGAIRSLGVELADMAALAWVLREMGQEVFLPPNVAGWPQGGDWITETSVAARAQALSYLTDPNARRYIAREAETAMAALEREMARFEVPPLPEVDAGDLRIGQVFGLEAIEGTGPASHVELVLSLYDVSFKGETFRSLNLYVGREAADEPWVMGFHTPDCRPGCFANWPSEDDPDWVGFVPVLGPPSAALRDHELVAAIVGHFEQILENTSEQRVWRHGGWEVGENERPMRERTARAMIRELQEAVFTRIAPVDTEIVFAASAQGGLGLAPFYRPGLDRERGEEMFDLMAEGQRRAAAPSHLYRDAEAWVEALPDGALLDRDRLLEALMALPPQGLLETPALFGPDLDEVLRDAVLAPEFQLN